MNLSEFKKAMKGHLKEDKPKILEDTTIPIPSYTADELINDPDPKKKKLKEVMKRLVLYAMKQFKGFIKPKRNKKIDKNYDKPRKRYDPKDLINEDLKNLAEDKVQEAWARFERQKREGKYIETGKFEGYFKGIIDKLKLEYIREVKEDVKKIHIDYKSTISEGGNEEIEPTIDIPARQPSPIDEAVREAIENIKDEDLREILKLKMYDKMTQEQIAKIKNWTIDVTKKMFQKAYAEFKKEWEFAEGMKILTPLTIPLFTTILYLLILSLISWIFFRNPFAIYKIIGNWLDPYIHKILDLIFKVLSPLPRP